MLDTLANQPFAFWLGWAVCAFLVLEAASKYRKPSAVPLLIGYATVAAWFLLEPVYTPEEFAFFDYDTLDGAFLQVAAFLVLMRVFSAAFEGWALSAKYERTIFVADIPADTIFYYCVYLWVILLIIGCYRMDWDVIAALFPMGGRFGAQMWSREAAGGAGSSGFLVSTGGYLYTFVCASFGILLPFIKKKSTRTLAYLLIAVSLPYFFMQGARNLALAAVAPMIASYLLFGRSQPVVKLIVAVVWFVTIDFLFKLIITYRNVGFGDVITGNFVPSDETKHLGLNMMTELYYINSFYSEGLLKPSWGWGYVAEAANAIPRAIWPDKPLIGIEYAVLRGFGGGDADIGVTTTISHGLIGQGVSNFGPYLGPLGAAMLFTGWLMFLTRLRTQQHSPMRLTLFLLGLGLTFNLGREITLLVLWPMVFGYVLVRYLEYRQKASIPTAPTALKLYHGTPRNRAGGLSSENAPPYPAGRGVPRPSVAQGGGMRHDVPRPSLPAEVSVIPQQAVRPATRVLRTRLVTSCPARTGSAFGAAQRTGPDQAGASPVVPRKPPGN